MDQIMTNFNYEYTFFVNARLVYRKIQNLVNLETYTNTV